MEKKKLVLNRESLRELSDSDRKIEGVGFTLWTCDPSSATCTAPCADVEATRGRERA